MNRRVMILMVLLVAACGGAASDGADSSAEAPEATVAQPSETTATTGAAESELTTTTSAVVVAPGVAALTSGRGDDGSLEVGVWFAADPFEAGDVRLLIGTDSDESYPGTGDPRTHLDGWIEIADGIGLFDAGTAVATGDDLSALFSWTGPSRQAWFYFIGNIPVRAGTVWVIVEVDGSSVTGGVAGTPLGVSCSYQAAGVDFGPAPTDLPDNGAPCRYPLG
jgi:hypothetical protein